MQNTAQTNPAGQPAAARPAAQRRGAVPAFPPEFQAEPYLKMDEAQLIQILAMVAHCPSGSLTCALAGNAMPVEPDLSQLIAVTTEITSTGSVAGPLWVTGSLPVTRADGQPFEMRNRITLCGCGRSHHKPLCDSTHRTPA